MSQEVDDYVKTKLQPQHQDHVQRLRELMRECAPEATEVITYGSPAWKGNKMLAIISPTASHITLAFDHGVEFEDRHGVLEGVGKRSRHVKIKPADTLAEDAIRDYIAQAVQRDQA